MQSLGESGVERAGRLLSERKPRTIGDPGLKPSAVLVLLYQKEGETCVLFNKRTEEVEFNKGEMCFPGGGRDPDDTDLEATALRETCEEMGVLPKDVTIMGELDEASTRFGFLIHPFVGTIPYPYQFKPSPVEVAEVLEIPVAALLDGRNVREEATVQLGGRMTSARSYAFGHHLIYGVTARILQQFLEVLESDTGPRRL